MNEEIFPPFQQHSDTSIDAAIAIELSSDRLRERVFKYIHKCGTYGATDDEVQVALNMNPSTQRPRRIELLNQGRVYRTNMKRKTRSGRGAVVWVTEQNEATGGTTGERLQSKDLGL